MLRFGSSGIRGRFGIDITVNDALALGRVTGAAYPTLALGRDPRTSSPAMTAAFAAGAAASGAAVTDLGLVATPTLAYAARGFACGIMITASHNPPEYNGIKFWNPDGSAFSREQEESIEGGLADLPPEQDWTRTGPITRDDGATERHIRAILGDGPSVRRRVVVDTGGGAGGAIAPELLRRLGCEVIPLNTDFDGSFSVRPSEPKDDTLGLLKDLVRSSGADLGIAHDGDADRMVTVDETGSFVDPNHLMLFLATGAERIVTPLNTTLAIETLGIPVIRTKVGDVHVSAELKELGGGFGAESSGTWIFPELSYCPDGPAAAVRLLRMLGDRKLSEVVADYPRHPLSRSRFPRQGDPGPILAGFAASLQEQGATGTNDLDGIHATFLDGWILLRPSGTEPILRLTIEATTTVRLAELEGIARTALTAAGVPP